jgi:hypothetical protein
MTIRSISLIAAAALLMNLAGCATGKQWNVSGGDRKAGVVRISYEYPEFKEPTLSDADAAELAAHRCDLWGYEGAQPIPGQVRQCSNMDGNNCDLWRVTREFQCVRGAGDGFAGLAGQGARFGR